MKLNHTSVLIIHSFAKYLRFYFNFNSSLFKNTRIYIINELRLKPIYTCFSKQPNRSRVDPPTKWFSFDKCSPSLFLCSVNSVVFIKTHFLQLPTNVRHKLKDVLSKIKKNHHMYVLWFWNIRVFPLFVR